jgi:hypothetical protein
VISTYFPELKELMQERGFGKCTSDQAYVFDRIGQKNYQTVLNLIFEKCTIEIELQGIPPRGYAFGRKCQRKVKKTFTQLRKNLQELEKEKEGPLNLTLDRLEDNEIFTRTLQGILA